jgi:hypothetical protein
MARCRERSSGAAGHVFVARDDDAVADRRRPLYPRPVDGAAKGDDGDVESARLRRFDVAVVRPAEFQSVERAMEPERDRCPPVVAHLVGGGGCVSVVVHLAKVAPARGSVA